MTYIFYKLNVLAGYTENNKMHDWWIIVDFRDGKINFCPSEKELRSKNWKVALVAILANNSIEKFILIFA